MAVDLIAGLRAAQSLSKFLDGPVFLDAIAEVGIQTAHTSLKRASLARDRPAQIWSVVNHLEQADVALRLRLTKFGGAIRITAPNLTMGLTNKRRYVLCLLAACYRYLHEDELAMQALNEAPEEWLAVRTNPLNLRDVFSRDMPKDDAFWIDVQEYRSVLNTLPRGQLPRGDLLS